MGDGDYDDDDGDEYEDLDDDADEEAEGGSGGSAPVRSAAAAGRLDSAAELLAGSTADFLSSGIGAVGSSDVIGGGAPAAAAAAVPEAAGAAAAAAAPGGVRSEVGEGARRRQLEQALMLQMEMQKKLHEQLEVRGRWGVWGRGPAALALPED